MTEHECIIPSDQAKVISQITSFERSSILQRREDMLKQCDDEQTDVALISMKLFEDEGKSSPPAFIAMQEFLQNTLSETQVEEDEEFFPKGFNPVLTFSIVDGELAFTQVDETQVEEQDPTGGYRIEFINPEPILPRPAEPLPSNPIIQTQVPSSTVAVPVAENTAPSTTTVPTADVEIVVAASDAGKHQTTTTVAAPTMSAKALLSSAAEKQSKASNGKGQLKQSTLTMEKRSSSSSGSQKSAVATPRPQTVVPVLESTQVPTPEGKSSKQQVQDQIMPSIVPTKKSPPAESTPIEKPTITNKRASTKSSIGSPVHATKDTKNNVKKGRNDGYESDSSISSVRMTRSQVAALAALASNKETKKKDQKVALSKPASSSSSMKEEPKPSVDNQVGIRTRHQKSKAVATPDKARREAMVGRRVVKDFPNVGLVRGAVVAYRK